MDEEILFKFLFRFDWGFVYEFVLYLKVVVNEYIWVIVCYIFDNEIECLF